MKVSLIRADELTPTFISQWNEFQKSNVALKSPYFRAEFVQAVADVRSGVEVAVIEDAGEVIGFFPFQRRSANVAVPVGGPMSDLHGPVMRTGFTFPISDVFRACDLSAWNFHGVPTALSYVEPFGYGRQAVAQVDVDGGFEAYRARLPKASQQELKSRIRQRAQVDREIGGVRFVPRVTEPQILRTLIEWKSEHFHDTSAPNIFSAGWPIALLERLLYSSTATFSGVMSVLYVQDELAAIHVGMISYDVMHYWIISYNRRWAKYSPGRLLLLELIQASDLLGIRRIDLGFYDNQSQFKKYTMTGLHDVWHGSIDMRPVRSVMRRHWWRTTEWIKSTPLRKHAIAVARTMRLDQGRRNLT